MADKYYRLVCFVVDICADVLRKYFVKLAKTDAGNTYTSVEAYLSHRNRDVMQLFNSKKLKRDQYHLLYPDNGTADENQWDISILVTLITELFAMRLQPLVVVALKYEIRGIRNELQCLPNTGNISDDDFDDWWRRLDDSVRLIAKITLDTNEQASLLEKISILRQETVQKPGPSEVKSKRTKVADDVLARLQAGFESTMKELSDDFKPPNEMTDIRAKLRDCHHVVVTGCNNNRYFETALAAIKGMDYNIKRSVEMHTSSDWRHINPEDVDLVLCIDPFGRLFYDESKAKAMEDIFKSMIHSTKKDDGDKALDIVIVTDLNILQECKMHHDHELLDKVVKVFTDTSSTQSADLTIDNTIPDEISSDPRTRELYEKAIQKGTEKDSIIRIMVIGCFGQGKTSLVRNLLKQSIEGVETTNGIDLHKCTVINDNDWKMLDNEDLNKETVQRLVNIALKETTYETTSSASEEENCLPNKHELRPQSAMDISRTTDEKNDKTDEYEDKRENVKINKSQIADAAETLVRNKKVNYENLNSFKTELEIVESIQEEIKLENNVTLNVWDYGGEFVFYATHQIFHSKQAVYLLVFNLSIALDTIIEDKEFPLHQKKMRDYLKFWVTSVSSFVGSRDGMEPAIVLVGTHADKLNARSNSEDYFENVRQIFGHSVCLNHIQSNQFAISNTNGSESEFDALRSYITRLGQRQLKTRIPAKWILLETALKMNKQKKIITIDQLIEIDSHTDSPLQTDDSKETMDQIKLFLSYHHAKGTFCYFDENNLSNHVVLDPQFLVDAFRCVFTSEKFCKVRPKMRHVWEELCNTAIIRAELFEEVWRQEKDNNFYEFKQLLIEYMQKHHIIAEVLAYELESESVIKRLGYFIVPSLLKISADDDTMRSYLEGKPLSTVSLCYKFEHETMAPFTYQACLAGLIGRWPLANLDNTHVLFDNVAACEIEREHAGVLMLTENKLELLVVSLCPPDNVKADVCDMFRRYVEAVMIKRMHKLNANKHEGQFFSLAARCLHTDHGTRGSSRTFSIDNIQSCNYEKIPCPDGRSHCLQVRSIVKEWFMTDLKQDNVPKRKLSDKEYSTLAMAIGNGWDLLGSQLGLNYITLDHIRMDKDNTAARIYEMFLKWDSQEGDQATLDVIVQAIENCNSEKVHVNLDVIKNIINGF
ncbi:uncharacterized protein LOC132754861 isoform X2 [Ruditapes philippinarum]|nr:uncharacterized protein LOC132754861 isoform X2 [Ruditapes philippinarum]XP_060601577.1 uncharacterized protein LOC132754861 isoform X2 [Ruditapes philippinarum]XP_060601578.1 uncharacterized protein LOC132754861 isoform X2 [Ruditapes philippinarum]